VVEGPLPSPASPPIYQITEQERFVPVRDGVRLQTRTWVPTLPPGSPTPPCVAETDGYDIALDAFFIPTLQDLAKRGYAVTFARLRGTPPSEGVRDLYNKFGEDGHDIVEWVAAEQRVYDMPLVSHDLEPCWTRSSTVGSSPDSPVLPTRRLLNLGSLPIVWDTLTTTSVKKAV
jgi:X-Pro dipeptidyl-peptidase (S15 family)